MEGIRKIGGDMPGAEQVLDPKRQVLATFLAGVRCVQRGEMMVVGMGNPFEGDMALVTENNAGRVLSEMQRRFEDVYPDLFAIEGVTI